MGLWSSEAHPEYECTGCGQYWPWYECAGDPEDESPDWLCPECVKKREKTEPKMETCPSCGEYCFDDECPCGVDVVPQDMVEIDEFDQDIPW